LLNFNHAIHLILLDIDGTIRRSDGSISDRTGAVIRALTRSGKHVVLASGRCATEVANISHACGGSHYGISCTGALVLDSISGQVVHADPIDKRDCQAVLEIASAFDLRFIMNTIPHKVVNTFKAMHGSDDRFEVQLKTDAPTYLQTHALDAYQCVLQERIGQTSKRILEARSLVLGIQGLEIANISKKLFDLSYTGAMYDHFIDIVFRGASKGHALNALALFLNVPMDQVLAIGDGDNDLSMLQCAGTGVAMGNAVDDLKQAADFVTSSNDEDGVAEVLESLLSFS
jgi:Cof subfamily protein (haloacid dehalogenase superfamily)